MARPSVRGAPAQPGPETPVYVISVAAELTGLHPQTLRTYDRIGLVQPGRAGGGGRRYSLHDIAMLREVAELTALGIGLEGVRRILDLEHQVTALRIRVTELEDDLSATQFALQQALQHRPAMNPNLPAVVPGSSPTGRAVTVWRRDRT